MGQWIELFNGRDLAGWAGRGKAERGPCGSWRVCGDVRLRDTDRCLFDIQPGTGVMVNGDDGKTLDVHTVLEHGSCDLDLEFCVAEGSNSGVYLMGQYEIQILDSWGTPVSELAFHSNGGIYGRWIAETQTAYDGHAPLRNPSRPPGEWQRLEVAFRAPEFDTAGQRVSGACFERVLLNGTVIHEDVTCTGPTRGAWSEVDVPKGPLRLQGDHGPVAYRNVRIRLRDLDPTGR